MVNRDLALLRRKEMVGVIAAVAWGIGLFVPPSIAIGWIFAAYWVALDTRYRGIPAFWWTVFALLAGPLALLLYYVSRPPVPAFCSLCGSDLETIMQACPTCGRQTYLGRAAAAVNQILSGLTESLAPGSADRARHTAKHLAISLAAVVVLGYMISKAAPAPIAVLLRAVWIFSFAAYWVLVPWWIYLDATWRRMDAVPWGLLALLTNVFGLVTYLVIRYPDPHTCPQCGAYLATELKRCPYCGSEAEPICPRCQAPVKADWVYCPACAAELPTVHAADSTIEQSAEKPVPSISVRGTVVDALSRSPISGAEVKIDSKSDAGATSTDAAGRFMLTDLEPRPYVLVASAQSYVAEAKGFTPTATDPAQVHFMLYPALEDSPALSPADGDCSI